MEQSKRENQHLFKRFLVYHCFRDSKSASEAASLLNQIYENDKFVSLKAVEWLYSRFKEQSFNFDDLCRLDFQTADLHGNGVVVEVETPSEEQIVVPVMPVSDDLLLHNELMDKSEVENPISAPAITLTASAEEKREQEANSNSITEPTVVKRKRGRPPKSSIVPKPFEDSETAKAQQERKHKEAAIRQRPSLPREARKPKPPPPPPPPTKPKGKIRIRKASRVNIETESPPPADPKFIIPKAVIEQGTSNSEITFEDIAADGLGSSNMSGMKRRNLRRRQLYLHCFQAKYNSSEAAKYLCSVYGEGFTSKSSVGGWYRKFRQNDFSLDDGKRPGRVRRVNEAELEEYMTANPDSTVTQLCEVYNVHRKTMMRCLHNIGYHFVTDRWEKLGDRAPAEPVTDHQLCEYKLRHPQATVREVAEHFLVNRGVVARRLRALGFDIPKWPVYAVKRYNSREKKWEYRSVGLRIEPGENVRKRTYAEIKASAEKKRKLEVAAAVASNSTTTDPDSTLKNGENSTVTAEVLFAPEQLQMLELVQLDTQQQQQQQQMTSAEASFALPAVLRHKTNSTTVSAITTATINSTINSSSSNSGNLHLQTSTTISTMQSQQQNSFSFQLTNGNQTLVNLEQQQKQTLQQRDTIVQGPLPSSETLLQTLAYIQTNDQLPYNGFDSDSSSFSQQMLDNGHSVQSLLHPYYM